MDVQMLQLVQEWHGKNDSIHPFAFAWKQKMTFFQLKVKRWQTNFRCWAQHCLVDFYQGLGPSILGGQAYQVFLGPISQNLSEVVDWGSDTVVVGLKQECFWLSPRNLCQPAVFIDFYLHHVHAWKVAANVTLQNNRLLILPFTSLPDACHNGTI